MILFSVICFVALAIFLSSGFDGSFTYAQRDSFCVSGVCFPRPPCSEASIIGSTVSGAQPGGPKEYAMDGNLSTYWVDWGVGSYLELDLGGPQVLCNVELAWPYGEVRTWYFDISSVNDSKAISLYSGASSGSTSDFEKYDFPESISENVIITVNGNSKTNYSGISEVKIFSRNY
jgi:hypothetical protein